MTTIIPAIDIIEGKCVRLNQGDYSQKKVYNENPLEVAKMFEGAGLTNLHLVDLDGAKAKKVINYRVLEQIASRTNLVIDFGGGIQSDEDLHIAFESGAQMVTGGSVAIKDQSLFEKWLSSYGANRIILGADAKDRMVAVSGWQEQSERDVVNFIDEYVQKGVKRVISTDVSKDGMLQGLSLELYAEIMDVCPQVDLIASGGVSSMDDIYKVAEMDMVGVIVGKAIYEGCITISDISNYILEGN